MLLLILLAFDQPTPLECKVISCTEDTCVIDTPEGTEEVWRRRGWRPGLAIECPATTIEPT